MNEYSKDLHKIFKAGLVVFILLGIFLIAISLKTLKETSYVGDDIPPMTTISVSGQGEAVAIPDIATFTFTVVNEAATVNSAQTAVSEKVSEALTSLKESGISEKDIKTQSYNISPRYEYPNIQCITYPCPSGTRVLRGYEVSQSILVKIRDTEKAGDIIDSIGDMQISQVSGLNFAVDDMESVRAKAREEAIKEAKEKAQKLAKDLDVRLVKITGFYEREPSPYYDGRTFGLGGAESAPAKAQIPVGEDEVTSQITIVYEIE